MANEMIALQARAPQMPGFGDAIQQNTQLINMMMQQKAADRQAAAQQQAAQLAQVKEAREAAMAVPQLAEAKDTATSAHAKAVTDFMELSIVGMKQAKSPEQAAQIGEMLKQQFPFDWAKQSVDQTLSTMPQDPTRFEPWRQNTLFQSMKAEQQLQQHFQTVTNGAEQWTTATPEYAGALGGNVASEVAGSRVAAPQDIQYVRAADGSVIAMPKQINPAPAGAGAAPIGGADTVYGHGAFGQPSKPLTSMNLGEVQNYQRSSLIPATRGKVGAGADMGTGAVGTYQITHGTLAKYAPRVLGQNWQSQPFTAEAQDRIARAIYEDAKNGDLHKVWAGMPSNKPGAFSNVPWEQARQQIAKVESGGGRGNVQFGQTVSGPKPEKPAAGAENARAIADSVQHMYDLIQEAHDKGHLLSEDQSWMGNRMQEARTGRPAFPGGTGQKTSLDSIGKTAQQLMRLSIKEGTAGTLRTNMEQQTFLQSVGGGDPSTTYQTRLDAVRQFARQHGIKLHERPTRSGGGRNSRAAQPAQPRTSGGATVSDWE